MAIDKLIPLVRALDGGRPEEVGHDIIQHDYYMTTCIIVACF